MNSHNNDSAQAIAFICDESGKPAMSAKGDGEFASQIIAVAEEHGVPVRKEPELVNLLSEVPLGEDIPEHALVAVSEVLAFIQSLEENSDPEVYASDV
ncbi:MAG: flagellar protein FhlB [Gammaproteobacteria bacterium]|nr:flagellar protein FhlB [Gammaproteobacteria bacterium]